jgi:hypothetical protein
MSPAYRRSQAEPRVGQIVPTAARPRRNTSACTAPTPLDAIQYNATLAERRQAMSSVIVALIATAPRWFVVAPSPAARPASEAATPARIASGRARSPTHRKLSFGPSPRANAC